MAPRKPAAKKKVLPAAAKKAAPKKAAGKPQKAAPKSSRKSAPARPSGGSPKKTAGKKKVTRQVPAATAVSRKPAPRKGAAGIIGKKGDRLKDLKAALLKKKDLILKEAKQEIAKYISGETRQLVDTAIDEGDWAVVDISEDINLRRLDAHRKTLRDIEEVLRKIAEGTYGICEECGEEISEKRLSVIPTAALCFTCQEMKERMEAFAKEDNV